MPPPQWAVRRSRDSRSARRAGDPNPCGVCWEVGYASPGNGRLLGWRRAKLAAAGCGRSWHRTRPWRRLPWGSAVAAPLASRAKGVAARLLRRVSGGRGSGERGMRERPSCSPGALLWKAQVARLRIQLSADWAPRTDGTLRSGSSFAPSKRSADGVAGRLLEASRRQPAKSIRSGASGSGRCELLHARAGLRDRAARHPLCTQPHVCDREPSHSSFRPERWASVGAAPASPSSAGRASCGLAGGAYEDRRACSAC